MIGLGLPDSRKSFKIDLDTMSVCDAQRHDRGQDDSFYVTRAVSI